MRAGGGSGDPRHGLPAKHGRMEPADPLTMLAARTKNEPSGLPGDPCLPATDAGMVRAPPGYVAQLVRARHS